MKNTFSLPLFLKPLLTLFALCCLLSALCHGQWQADVRLTNDPGESRFPSISASGPNVHIVWEEYRDGNWEIYYKRSTDKGSGWGQDTRLTNNTAGSYRPSISVSGSFVHVVWYDYRDSNLEIYYKRSINGGSSWEPDRRLTNDPGNSFLPSISLSGPNVQIVWCDNRDVNEEIFYKLSTDNGSSWGQDKQLSVNTSSSLDPSISQSGSNVHIAWSDNRVSNEEIYYKRSTNNGTIWGSNERLTYNPAFSGEPSISVSGLIVHIAWADSRFGDCEIYYKRSTDNGIVWEADLRLTNAQGSSYSPKLSVSGPNVHLVWADYRSSYQAVYYKLSTNNGSNWGTDAKLSNSPLVSDYPSICVSDSLVHVTWEDNRDGNYEIYYKRDPSGNAIGVEIISSLIPKKFKLHQNYPNPFNPKTKILFSTPPHAFQKEGEQEVRLLIYDALSREITTLVNGRLKPGTYEAEWDGTNYPSGLYFYRLSAGDYAETRKMVLIK